MDTSSETTAGQQQGGEVYDTNQQTNSGYGDKSPSPLTVEEALKGFEGEETPSVSFSSFNFPKVPLGIASSQQQFFKRHDSIYVSIFNPCSIPHLSSG